jgi:hypothetical protein
MGRKGAWGKTTISSVRIDNLKSPIYRSRPRTVHIKAERSSNNKYSKDEGKKKKYGRKESGRRIRPNELNQIWLTRLDDVNNILEFPDKEWLNSKHATLTRAKLIWREGGA